MTPGASLVQSPIAALPVRTASFSAAAAIMSGDDENSRDRDVEAKRDRLCDVPLLFGIASRMRFAWIVESTRCAFMFRGAHAASVYVSAACRDWELLGGRTAKQFLVRKLSLGKNSAAKFAIARTRSLPQTRDEPRALPRTCSAALVFFKTRTIENA